MTAGRAQVCSHTLHQKALQLLTCLRVINHPPENPRCDVKYFLTVVPALSPGFYELSDGGSCSLSNSCTSVYSECLSSSQTSLLLLPMSPANSHISPPTQVDVCRRRSADESATQPTPPRATGLHLGSSRIRTSTTSTEQARPRPVSTGNQIFG